MRVALALRSPGRVSILLPFLCALLALTAPGDLEGQVFKRGELTVFGDPGDPPPGANVIDQEDIDRLVEYFASLSDVGGGCSGTGIALDAADVNDNTPEPGALALGEEVPVITIADLLQLKARVDGEFSALPPPAMCGLDDAFSSTLDMSGGMNITLETRGFDSGQQEIDVKLQPTAATLQGASLDVHGIGLALHADPSITDAVFLPAFAAALDFDIEMSPADPGNPSDVFLMHIGSIQPLATLGAGELLLGTILIDLPAALPSDPLLPPEDSDGDGLPDPVQIGARTFHTTIVERVDDCYVHPDLGVFAPCFADHVPVMGDAVVLPDEFLRGDANSDGQLDIADGVFLLQHLFLAGAAPGCLDAGDLDVSGALGVGDAMAVFGYQLLNGPAPAAPFPSCDVAPGGALLGCADYSPTLCN